MSLRAEIANYLAANPSQRYGQAAFNYVAAVRPDLAERYRGGPIDPFYDNGKVNAFIAIVKEQW